MNYLGYRDVVDWGSKRYTFPRHASDVPVLRRAAAKAGYLISFRRTGYVWLDGEEHTPPTAAIALGLETGLSEDLRDAIRALRRWESMGERSSKCQCSQCAPFRGNDILSSFPSVNPDP